MIGRDIEKPTWNQSTRHSRQKAITDHTSRSVPPLRPWVGKHQVKSRDGSRRQQLSNHIRDLESEGPSILQASLLELARSTSDSSRLPFDSNKIPSGIGSSDSGEKRTLPATEIDLERSGSTEERAELERSKAIRRDEFCLTCYGDRMGRHIFQLSRRLALCLAGLSAILGGRLALAAEPAPATTKTAIFAGGCFWCMQPPYDNAKGVVKTVVGYTGGSADDATYDKVSGHRTKHRESIQVTYDPAQITFEQLVDIFWHNINPT